MDELKLYQRKQGRYLIPLAGERIHAGFESPAADYEEERIDLNDYVTDYPEATFYARVIGECMNGSGIEDGDLLVVNRSLTPADGDVVVGILDGEFILRTLIRKGGQTFLVADHPDYAPIRVNETIQFQVWGVVPHTVLNQQKRKYVRAHRLQQFLR